MSVRGVQCDGMRRESENIRSRVREAKTVHAFIGVQVCSVHCVCGLGLLDYRCEGIILLREKECSVLETILCKHAQNRGAHSQKLIKVNYATDLCSCTSTSSPCRMHYSV